MGPDSDPLISEKRGLRLIMETRRAAVFAQNPRASHALRDNFLKAVSLPPHSIVASYSARGSEIDPSPLAEALRGLGHSIALPVMAGKEKPLVFRLYDPDEPLVLNRFGINEPGADAVSVVPGICLVPLLAFDRRGGRLGTGGGYYDRTLGKLRSRTKVLAVGLGFACQELPRVPTAPHDVLLDRIITEIQDS